MRYVDKALELSARYIISLELPPGVGKTYTAVKKALELASEGRTVIYALPNHQSLATAFAYAAKHYLDMARRIPARRLPYLVYYHGINRFCPLWRGGGGKLFQKWLDKALSEGWIDAETHRMLSVLGLEDASRIYGSNFICRYVCPVYKNKMAYKTERVFIPPEVASRQSPIRMLSGEARVDASEAMKALTSLYAKGLVAEVSPDAGSCLRAVLQKAVTPTGKQIVMKGALVLTPIHAVPFVKSVLEARIRLLRNRGFSIPPPLIVIDEYDYYVYMPHPRPVYSLKEIGREKEAAVEVMRREAAKKARGDPSYSSERMIAALAAYRVLDRLEAECTRFREALEQAPSAALSSSVASLVAECASEPIPDPDGSVVPPFAPREIDLSGWKDLAADVLSFLEEVEKEREEEEGVSYYDVEEAARNGIRYYLDLWESIYVAEMKTKGARPSYPVLYRVTGNVYGLGWAPSSRFYSIAKSMYMLATSKLVKASVYYKVKPARVPVVDGDGKNVAVRGGYLVAVMYDMRLAELFTGDSEVVLMSATGVPWTQIVSTRAEGIGYYRGTAYASGKTIASLLYPLRFAYGEKRGFSYMVISGGGLKKKILVLTLDRHALRSYARHIVLIPLADLPLLPNRGSGDYWRRLTEALSMYVQASVRAMAAMPRRIRGVSGVPSMLVLTQRKDVAAAYSVLLASAVSGRLEVCDGPICRAVQPSLRQVLAAVKNASHLVVSTGSGTTRFYVTWLRSRMSRGIDLPEDAVPLAVLLVGTPYRPPENLDIYPAAREESVSRATYLALPVYIGSMDPRRLVVVVHHPIDVAESVSELVQAIGRAIRRAWKHSLRSGRVVYRVAVLVPAFTFNKLISYAPFWFRKLVA